MTKLSEDEILQGILGLVLENPPSINIIASWNKEARKKAEKWAALEHLSASDNPVKRKPKPDFLENYK